MHEVVGNQQNLSAIKSLAKSYQEKYHELSKLLQTKSTIIESLQKQLDNLYEKVIFEKTVFFH